MFMKKNTKRLKNNYKKFIIDKEQLFINKGRVEPVRISKKELQSAILLNVPIMRCKMPIVLIDHAIDIGSCGEDEEWKGIAKAFSNSL